MKINKNKYEVPLSIVLFLLILFIISKQFNFIYASITIGILSLLSDWFAEKITCIWKKIMRGFGFINSHLLLSIIFFVVLTPIAFLFKFFKGDILNLKKNENTYYKERNHLYSKKDLQNPW